MEKYKNILTDTEYDKFCKQIIVPNLLYSTSLPIEIISFVQANTEFIPYLKIYFRENNKYNGTAKELLKYYICFAGIKTEQGHKLYSYVTKNLLASIPINKKNIILEINNLPDIKTLDDLYKIKIKGIGDGAKNFVREYYFNDSDVSYPTDRIFQKGLGIIYKLDAITPAKCKKIVSQWIGSKTIGSRLCFQIANYWKN